jgi:hypothetical protein
MTYVKYSACLPVILAFGDRRGGGGIGAASDAQTACEQRAIGDGTSVQQNCLPVSLLYHGAVASRCLLSCLATGRDMAINVLGMLTLGRANAFCQRRAELTLL